MSSILAETSSKAADPDDATSKASCPLLRCPDDVLLSIADKLSRAGIGYLVRTSRRCHQALNHHLYAVDWLRKDEFRGSALLWGCSVSKPETVLKALAAGADPNTELAWASGTWSLLDRYRLDAETLAQHHARSAVQLVAVSGYVEMARLLVESGKADFSRPMPPFYFRRGIAPAGATESSVFTAVRNDHGDLVHYLLRTYGYDMTDFRGDNLLACAVRGGHKAAIRAILRDGDYTDPRGARGVNGLFEAVDRRDSGLIRLILTKSRSDPNILCDLEDGDGGIQPQTPLYAAIRTNSYRTAEVLLGDPRVNPNISGPNLRPPLYYALKTGSQSTFSLLLRRATYDADREFEQACREQAGRSAEMIVHQAQFDETRLRRWYDVLESQLETMVRSKDTADFFHVKSSLDNKRDELNEWRRKRQRLSPAKGSSPYWRLD